MTAIHARKHLEDKLHPDLTKALVTITELPESAGMQRLIVNQIQNLKVIAHLGQTFQKLPIVPHPEVAAALAQTEQFWRDLRTEFGLLSSTEVAAAVGAASNRSYASDLRAAGKLVAVQRTNRFLYPGFQFDGGTVRPVVKQLLNTATRHGVSEKDVIYWLCAPTTQFRDERRPVDHLDDPGLVVEAAERHWGVDW